MAQSQLDQWQGEDDAPNQPPEGPATAAAIVLSPQPDLEPERPRWQRWGAIAAAVVALGGLGGLIWWFFLRTPPRPYVIDFSPSQSQYSVANQGSPTLNWHISNPRQIDALIVRGYAPDGTLLSGPEEYDLSGSLPVSLLPYCRKTRQAITCQEVPTQVQEPGQYRFELTLLPRAGLNLPPEQASSSLVTIADLPLPSVVELFPQQVIYSELGTPVSANTPTLAPPVNEAGILVNWVVNNPQTLQGLRLVVKQPGGGALGARQFLLRDSESPNQVTLPEELQPFCQLGEDLVCQGVPTGMGEVGKYQFELTPIPIGVGPESEDFPAAKMSEVVEVQPRPVRIAAFNVNGQPAQPNYMIPVPVGQGLPEFRLDWQVEAGSTARVEILPSPGSVGPQGTLPVRLPPSGSTTITLRVTDGQNPPLIRAITFETFNPNPNPPIVLNQAEPGQAPVAPGTAPAEPSNQPQQRPDPLGDSMRDAQNQREPGLVRPEDLRDRNPEDLNLGF
ncbi:MAG: hypothetical protein EA342_11765 [Leptolyngbya sp. LCM1.Bin17]|nr:MAG: hypothetical protein EA342_11765 [Leptolyngbya sp. LCM1.Bin17]